MEYILTKQNIECIDNLLTELKEKIQKGTITSRDFDYAYCQLARLVIQLIEYTIRNEKEFDKGYNLDNALVIGNFVQKIGDGVAYF